jgi:uncharacterized protein (DUF952 family)
MVSRSPTATAAITTVYKIVDRPAWQKAVADGVFVGAAVDLADGFVHFSTALQVAETAARHFAGRADLLLVAVDVAALGRGLVFEPSRGGDLFPHLYAPLDLAAVVEVTDLPLGPDGRHLFPELRS